MAEVVCLCDEYDLKSEFEAAFGRVAPELRLVRPEEASDPGGVRFALAHAPGPAAFDAFPALELVCSWGAGVDRLADHPGLRPGTALSRMTDPGQAEMMAAFAVHYVTGWHRRMFDYPAQQRARTWEVLSWTPNAVFPVGILGYGRMGAAIGRGLAALGYPVSGWAATARAVGGVPVSAGREALGALLERSAAVINVLPLTPETEGILNRDTLGRMREDAILIQLARGAHLVEADLLESLGAGRPALAALDVFGTEPLPRDHPFWTHPKVMITPHAGSTATHAAVAATVARAIAAVAAGRRPEGLVNRKRGY